MAQRLPCRQCGTYFSMQATTCPRCGADRNVTTNLQQPSLPPIVTVKSTGKDILKALISDTNPYEPWGKCVLDDMKQPIWGERIYKSNWQGKEGYFYKSMGEFIISAVKKAMHPRETICPLVTPKEFQDFTLQVQLEHFSEAAGIIFRSNAEYNLYYICQFYNDYTAFCCELKAVFRGQETLIQKGRVEFREKERLIGIVANGSVIDIYVDREKIISETVDLDKLDRGFIALYVQRSENNPTIFRFFKVWEP